MGSIITESANKLEALSTGSSGKTSYQVLNMNDQQVLEALLTQINKIPYGSVTFTVYRHGNKTVNVVANEHENSVFESNVEFIEWLLNGLKKISDTKQSGPINLSILAKNGKFTKVSEQRQMQITSDPTTDDRLSNPSTSATESKTETIDKAFGQESADAKKDS